MMKKIFAVLGIIFLVGVAAAMPMKYSFGVQVFNETTGQFLSEQTMNCTIKYYNQPTSGGLISTQTEQVTTDRMGYALLVTDINFGLNQSIYKTVKCNGDDETPRSQMMPRVFALQANNSFYFGGKLPEDYLLVSEAFSGDYEDLNGKPTIPQPVTHLPYANITGTPTIPPQITTFPYANLTGKPDIPSQVTSLPYSNITGAPEIPQPVTSLPYSNITGTPEIPAAVTSLPYSNITGTPYIPHAVTSLPYTNITGTPYIPLPVTSLPYANITGTPNIPQAVTSLPYSNITGTPTLKTNLSQFLNDAGYLLPAALSPYALTSALSSYALVSALNNYVLTADTSAWDKNTGDDLTIANLSGYVLTSATTSWDKDASNDFNGAYASLTGKPTSLSNFTNTPGYITVDTNTVYNFQCSAGQFVKNLTAAGSYVCATPGAGAEDDPQVGTLTNTKWCTTDGNAVNCATEPPVTAESDPQVGAVTNGKWCSGDGSAVQCSSDAPAATVPSIISQLDYVNYVTYFNEFNGDAVDTFPITLGTQSIQFTSQKFGTYRWISGTTIGNDAGIGLSYTTTTTGANYNVTYSYLDTRLMMASTAGYRMFLGFLKTSGSADVSTINTATVFFTNTSYGGAYWYAMTCNAAGAANCAIVNTTVARDTSFHRFTINAQDTYAEFYIDGTIRANITNKYPRNVGYAYVGTYQETTDTAADNHQLDYIYLRTKRR